MTQYETRPVSWLVGPVGVESYHEAVIEVRDQPDRRRAPSPDRCGHNTRADDPACIGCANNA